jgi:hypothetical protein
MIVDDLFNPLNENDELFTHLKKQFPQLRQRTRAQRDADRDQQLADRAAQAQAHKDALKNATPKEPTKTMSYDDSVVAFNDKTKALGYKRLSEEVPAGVSKTASTRLYNPATGRDYTNAELQQRPLNKFHPDYVAPAPAAPLPTTTSATAPTPSNITRSGLLAPKPAPAPVADFSKTAGFPGYNTTPASTTIPAKLPATLQPTTNLSPDATVTTGDAGTYNKKTGTATLGGKPHVDIRDLPPEYQKQIQQKAGAVAEALIRPVTELLQQAESKEDIQRIKQFVDQQFVKHGALTESAFAQRNQLINYIKEHSHTMAH